MVLSQTIMPAQVVPNIWGFCQGIIEGLSLLGPPTCPASWPASLVKRVNEEPAKRAMPLLPTTPAKSDKEKSFPRSSVKKSQPKQISDYWKDPERKREDEQSRRREEEKCRSKSSAPPILSLAEHEEPVSSLTSKTAPSQVSQIASHPPSPVCCHCSRDREGLRKGQKA